VVAEDLVQRRHTVEHGHAFPVHGGEDLPQVERGEQDDGRAEGHPDEEDRDLAVDVVQGQRGRDHFPALSEVREERPQLGRAGDEVGVGQLYALRLGRCPTRVRQDREVRGRIKRRGGECALPPPEELLERVHAGARGERGLLREHPLQGGKVLVGSGDDDPIQAHTRPLEVPVEEVLAHDVARPAVLKLEREFRARVDGAHRHHDRPRLEDPKVGDHELGTIDEVQRHPVPPAHAELHQAGCERIRLLAELAVGQVGPIVVEGRPAGECRGRSVEEGPHRHGGRLHPGRDPFRVMADPGMGGVGVVFAHATAFSSRGGAFGAHAMNEL